MPLSKLNRARLQLFALIPHCAPDFMPEIWEKTDPQTGDKISRCNSCYGYASNDPATRRLGGHNVPGLGVNQNFEWPDAYHGKRYKINHRFYREKLVGDGLIYAGRKKPKFPPRGCYAVAVFTELGRMGPEGHRPSYHCYRLDRDGYWSHKNGAGMPVLGHDTSHGRPITCPRDNVRKEYPYSGMKFIGYFYVPNSGIVLGRQDSIFPVQTSDPSNRKTPLMQPDAISRTFRVAYTISR